MAHGQQFEVSETEERHTKSEPQAAKQEPIRQDAPKPGFWNGDEPQAKPSWTLGAGLLSIPGSALLLSVLPSEGLKAAACAALVVAIPRLLTSVSRRDRALTEKDERLWEDRNDDDNCMLEVAVVVDGEVVGRDRGIGWFAEERLVFNGHGMSFALGRQDVLSRRRWRGKAHVTNGRLDVLPLRVETGRAHLEFTALGAGERADRQAAMFEFRFKEFKLRRDRPTREERQWPPLEKLTPRRIRLPFPWLPPLSQGLRRVRNIGVVFATFGMIAARVRFDESAVAERLRTDGITTTAVVEDRRPMHDSPASRYRFFEGGRMWSGTTPYFHPADTTIEVRYLPSDPNASQEVDFPRSLSSFGFGLAVVGWAMIVFAHRKREIRT